MDGHEALGDLAQEFEEQRRKDFKWDVIEWALVVVALLFLTWWCAGCATAPAKPVPPPGPPPVSVPTRPFDISLRGPSGPIAGQVITVNTHVSPADNHVETTNGDGYTIWTLQDPTGDASVYVTVDGYQPYDSGTVHLVDYAAREHNFIDLEPAQPPLPPPASRQEILDSHESFQGAVLHTAQFGDLNWWPTAWVSLSADDRIDSYPQIASWGDTDITVSATWDYGEGGQPYGSGQLVPPKNYFAGADYASADVVGFRASIKDVLLHQAANGKPFVPVVFMSGDNGFSYYMWAMPLIVKALQPQPTDPVDLTTYVKLRMCYDSCVPGWQPPSQIDDAILATRAACPGCVIALEFSSGYPCWGGGDGCGDVNFNSPAGQALDEVDWEGNSWPPTNWDQYWQVLARLLGPTSKGGTYVRPSNQPADDDPSPPWYMKKGTPRGPWGVHCLEPYTYQFVRGQVPLDQVPVVWRTLRAMGCGAIDTPYPAGAR